MNHSEIVSFIWGVADLIRDTFKRGKYQDVMLPLTVLRRLDLRSGTHEADGAGGPGEVQGQARTTSTRSSGVHLLPGVTPWVSNLVQPTGRWRLVDPDCVVSRFSFARRAGRLSSACCRGAARVTVRQVAPRPRWAQCAVCAPDPVCLDSRADVGRRPRSTALRIT